MYFDIFIGIIIISNLIAYVYCVIFSDLPSGLPL